VTTKWLTAWRLRKTET